MGISLISAPDTAAFVGTIVCHMPQAFVLETNRYTAAPQASTTIADNGSGKVRYAYTSHPYKVGDVITGSLFSNALLNVRQTVTDIAANTFDTTLVWASAFAGVTGTVTRTNDNLMLEVRVVKAGVTISSGYYLVDATGRVMPHVNDILLRSMTPIKPALSGGAVIDTGLFYAYSIYAREVFDDVAGLQKTADDYTSGTYYAAYGHRVYTDARTTAAFLLDMASYGRTLTDTTTVVLPRGATLLLSGMIKGGAGITDVRVRSDEVDHELAASNKTGTPVTTADAYCKVTAAYGPDVYGANVQTAEVYLWANNTTRISGKITVRFVDAMCEGCKFVWLNHFGGWNSIHISHFMREEFTASQREIAWRGQATAYTVGDAFKKVYQIQANIGFNIRGQIPSGVAARSFSRITESELVYANEDKVLIPVVVDTDDMTYNVRDEVAYFTIQCIYAYFEI